MNHDRSDQDPGILNPRAPRRGLLAAGLALAIGAGLFTVPNGEATPDHVPAPAVATAPALPRPEMLISPEQQKTRDYIESPERAEAMKNNIARIGAEITTLVRERPDVVRFRDLKTREVTPGFQGQAQSGTVELLFGNSPESQKVIVAYLNTDPEGMDTKDSRDIAAYMQSRIAGVGVITGADNDPRESFTLSANASPAGFQGLINARYHTRTDNAFHKETSIYGSTFDLRWDPEATVQTVIDTDLGVAQAIFSAVQAERLPDPNATDRDPYFTNPLPANPATSAPGQ